MEISTRTKNKSIEDQCELTFGLREGEIIHIEDVPSGQKCGCVCPGCSDPLVAKKGAIRAHHFAHARGYSCDTGLQTALHLAGKAILLKSGGMRLPKASAEAWDQDEYRESYTEEKVVESAWIAFDHVTSEKKLGATIPDLLVSVGGRSLIVEIAVTHKVDDLKLQKIKELNVSCLEVLLGSYRSEWNWETLEKVVVQGVENKHWVFHAPLAEWKNKTNLRLRAVASKATLRKRAFAQSQKVIREQKKLLQLQHEEELEAQRRAVDFAFEQQREERERAFEDQRAQQAKKDQELNEQRAKKAKSDAILGPFFALRLKDQALIDEKKRFFDEDATHNSWRSASRILALDWDDRLPAIDCTLAYETGILADSYHWQACLVAMFYQRPDVIFSLKNVYEKIEDVFPIRLIPSSVLEHLDQVDALAKKNMPRTLDALEDYLKHLVRHGVLIEIDGGHAWNEDSDFAARCPKRPA